MSDDDDVLSAPVPDPDAESTASERKQAKAFADLIDQAIAGRPPPPALAADDRALLEVATVIRAASGNVELAAPRRDAIIEDALRRTMGVEPSSSARGGAIAIESRAPAKRRLLPWAISGASLVVAAAALIALWVRRPPVDGTTAQVPIEWRSRPTDALVGRIERAQSADAHARIETIFADRLAGYRDRRLTRPGGKR